MSIPVKAIVIIRVQFLELYEIILSYYIDVTSLR